MATTAPGPATSLDAEIAEKLRRVRDYLSARGLAAVYLKRQDNFAWLTGGHLNHVGLATEVGVAGLLVTPTSHYLISNNIEAPRLVEEEGLEDQGYQAHSFPWHTDSEAALVRRLAGAGPLEADVALGYSAPLGAEFKSLRFELTTAETDRYRWLGSTAATQLESVAAGIRPGDTEADVAGRLAAELWAGRIDCPGIFIGADERISRFRHPIVTGTPIARRAMLSVNARKWGLLVSFTRFVSFREPEEEVRRRYRVAVEIDCAMIAATRPGARVSDIFALSLEEYSRHGFPEEPELHHQGGAIGYLPREYKATTASTETVLPHQAFAWNPSITGAKSEDTILVAEKGPEIITPPVAYPTVSVSLDGLSFARPDILLP